jgi:hypothetical protein
MPRIIKKTISDWYWVFGPLAFLAGTVVIAFAQTRIPLQHVLVLGGGIMGGYYFLQKQVLEELNLFERLFADFNRRYCTMNAPLQRMLMSDAPLTAADRALLEDYFNLCAEEYLYRTYGIIDVRVWRAWCRGMLQYLADPRIAEFWEREEACGSYYGLTVAEIEKGAGPPDPVTWPAIREQDGGRKAA